QKDISDYFLSWLGLEAPSSSRELTEHFLDAVAQLPAPVDEESGEPMEPAAFREQVVNFAVKNPARTVNIKAFDEQFYGDETPLQDFVQQNQVELGETFRYDRQALRDYHFHRFKADGLYFGCRHAFLLSGEVRVEGDTVIIDHPELAEQLAELLRDLG
ncbi:MAG: nucleoid-associated protein, partial [Lewinella sp.]|nr:nucleoid-associated protein [Lewinella sp.]